MKIAPPDSLRCRKTIYHSRGLLQHRCWFKSVRDDFCRRHHPDAQRARDQEKARRWDAKHTLGQRTFNRMVESEHLLKLAARHAPPKLKRRIEKFMRGDDDV